MCWYKIWILSYHKWLILRETNEKGLDNPKCVIYQGTVTSTENEKRKIVKATSVQKDVVDCLDIVEGNFVYQMKNASYKSCTLEAVQKSNESDDQTVQCGGKSEKNVEPCCKRLMCLSLKHHFFFVWEKGASWKNKKQWTPETLTIFKFFLGF